MRIMLVARVTADHRPGGMPHVSSHRADALAAAGHEVHMVTTSKHAEAGTVSGRRIEETSNSLTKWFTPSPAHNWSREFADQCLDVCLRIQPDIIHTDSFDRTNPWWRGKPACTKMVAVTMHGFGMGAWRTKWNLAMIRGTELPQIPSGDLVAEIAALRGFDRVIGVSRHEWGMLRDEYGLASARLVYNPIAPWFFDPPARRQRSYFLCCAVSQGDVRGFHACVSACTRAHAELRVASDVPHRRMADEYDGAKAILLPTAFAQGFDMAVCEGRARGCPAIMSSTGSYLTEMEPFDASVQPHDPESLVDAIESFKPPGDRSVVREAAERHRPERHASAWLDALA